MDTEKEVVSCHFGVGLDLNEVIFRSNITPLDIKYSTVQFEFSLHRYYPWMRGFCDGSES